jgi:Zn ribbon nucleic-acid-binding protein
VPETLRLDVSLVCPECNTVVKPYILGREPEALTVECPVSECGHEWQITKESLVEDALL